MGGARRLDSYFARGLLDARSTLHLVVRLAVRVNQVLSPSGGATAGAGWIRLTLPAFVLVDLLTWRVLRRSDRFGLAWRLPLDALDVAFWGLSPVPATGRYDLATMIGIPLAIEAGFRIGLRGLVVPTAILLVAGPVRVLAGRPVLLPWYWWLLASVALGAALWAYCRRLDERAEDERRRHISAERRRAFLAGQNAVAMGASSVVDAVEGLVPLLGRPSSDSALGQLAGGWKARLSETTAAEATYLHVALLEWERHHNRHPDLASLVELRLAPGDGTALLTSAQVQELCRKLDQLGLRGTLRVALTEGSRSSRLPTAPLHLRVGPHLVTITPDPSAAPRAIDPAPSTYLFIASLQPVGIARSMGAIPWPVAAAGAALCLAAWSWSHRLVQSRGTGARGRLFAGAVFVALVLTAITSVSVRQLTSPEGDPVYPFTSALLLVAFLGGVYHGWVRHLPWAVAASVGAVCALGLLLSPAAVTVRSLAAGVLWSVMPYLPTRRVSVALRRAASQHAAGVAEEDRRLVMAEFRAGKESVTALVRRARDDASRQLAELTPTLDPRLAELASTRLAEVDRRLHGLLIEPQSPASLTPTG